MADPDRYQGFLLELTQPRRDPSRRATTCVVWVCDPSDEPLFGVCIVATDPYARENLGAEQAPLEHVEALALRWAHGLIDTETWEPGRDAAEVLRTRDWTQGRHDARVTDEDLQQDLLGVFARMARIQGQRHVDYALRFDVEGFSDVRGVSSERVRGLLNEMHRRGWLEPYGYEKHVPSGHARMAAAGFDRWEQLRAGSARAGMAQVVSEAEAYIEGNDFEKEYPGAFANWKHASDLLSQKPLMASIVGYACRDAMKEFAIALVDVHRIENAPPLDQPTARIRCVVTRQRYGERRADALAALVNYWDKTYDLVQRQAKGAVKEGEDLTDEDARRVVFLTAFVMYELSRLPVV